MRAVACGSLFLLTAALLMTSSHYDRPALTDCVSASFTSVGTSFEDIWGGLEIGRLQWLSARYATQGFKANLQAAYTSSGAGGGGGEPEDQSDAKMLWVYALGTALPPCAGQAAAWAQAARIQVREQPLVGYNAEL